MEHFPEVRRYQELIDEVYSSNSTDEGLASLSPEEREKVLGNEYPIFLPTTEIEDPNSINGKSAEVVYINELRKYPEVPKNIQE